MILYPNIMSKIKIIEENSILFISGRIDTITASEFEQTLIPWANRNQEIFKVNLNDVDYISSSGLRSFIICQKLLHKKNHNLTLCNIQPEVKEIFDISGISILFEFE